MVHLVLQIQLSTSPARSALISALEGLRRTSPSLVRQFLPVLDQLEPIFASLADGTQQFVPHPEETAEQLRTQYGKQPERQAIEFQVWSNYAGMCWCWWQSAHYYHHISHDEGVAACCRGAAQSHHPV